MEVAWSARLTICTDIAVVTDKPDAVVYVGPQTESHQQQRALEVRTAPPNMLSATIGSGRANYINGAIA